MADSKRSNEDNPNGYGKNDNGRNSDGKNGNGKNGNGRIGDEKNGDGGNGDGKNDESRSSFLQTPNISGPTRRLPLVSYVSDGKNIEMTTLGASQKPELCSKQQQTQQNTTSDHRIQLLNTVAYMVLSFVGLFCSSIDVAERIRNFSAMPNYWYIVLDAVIAINSLIIFCVVFHLSNKSASYSDRMFFVGLFCSLLNLVSASVMYHLHEEWIAVVVLISATMLLFLLYIPWLMSNFADKNS
ncbi:uncharacterized protein LOC106882980 [Octopus bimaculoides]|uniref:Uncharacterized protein n=1 Tax=Octopus bimaculoides TaxID=37653 RepID=A0A0L8FK15_OCTBM|nr:uncharacterized protein LOC106882980 [Octopus bimaculoides]|eukprot:XP_014789313.1 PREDICTED: uncharacterized protein LOC106882980 [Octopus bimaculoides]